MDNFQANVRLTNEEMAIIDLGGNLTGSAKAALLDAYYRASGASAHIVALNFNELENLNSAGAALLITLQNRADREKVHLIACGLNALIRQAFELTRLSDVIGIVADEGDALTAAGTLRQGQSA